MRDFSAYCDDLLRIFMVELGARALTHLRIRRRAYQFGRLSCSIWYPDGSKLHMRVWADCRDEPIVWPSYSFQYLDDNNALLFRYDDTPNHPGLTHFPHHLHLPGGIQGAPQPGPREVRDRIAGHLGL